MRNPLHAASAWNALLKDQSIDSAKREHGLAAIQRSLAHLTRMVDDLSEVSRIGADKVSIEPDEVDLAEVVRDCVEAGYGQRGQRRNGASGRRFNPGRADATRMRQV